MRRPARPQVYRQTHRSVRAPIRHPKRRTRPGRLVRFFIVAALAVMAVGCSSPSEPPFTKGMVTFGDTHLGLWSTINIGPQQFVTDDGHYSIRLTPGNYSYEVATLFGTHTGEIAYEDKQTLHLQIPSFRGWSPRQFDSLAMFP